MKNIIFERYTPEMKNKTCYEVYNEIASDLPIENSEEAKNALSFINSLQKADNYFINKIKEEKIYEKRKGVQ